MKAGQAGDVSLLNLRARCLVMMGDLDNAFRHLQTAVRSDPDNTTIRAFYRSLRDIVDGKNSGDDSFKRQSYDDAVRSYSQALDSFRALGVKCKDFEAKIYLNRATSYHKIRRNEDGLKDCNMAISLKDDYVKAYIRRSECFQALGGPENIERAIRLASVFLFYHHWLVVLPCLLSATWRKPVSSKLKKKHKALWNIRLKRFLLSLSLSLCPGLVLWS